MNFIDILKNIINVLTFANIIALIAIILAFAAWKETRKTNKLELEQNDVDWRVELTSVDSKIEKTSTKKTMNLNYTIVLKNSGFKDVQHIQVKGTLLIDYQDFGNRFVRTSYIVPLQKFDVIPQDSSKKLNFQFTKMAKETDFVACAAQYGALKTIDQIGANVDARKNHVTDGLKNPNMCFSGVISYAIAKGAGKRHLVRFENQPLDFDFKIFDLIID